MPIEQAAVPAADRLILAFVGDMMIGRKVEAALAFRRPEDYWRDFLPELERADLAVGNLECPITESARRWPRPKTWKFRASRRALEILQGGRIGAVSFANNHSGDYCAEGLTDTLEAVTEAGIVCYGAGRTLAEAQAPKIVERRGRRLGLLAFSDRMPEFGATESAPGTNFAWPPKGEPEARRIMAPLAAAEVDLRLVSAHWGPDLMSRPTRARRAFARALVEGGADVIHGHSSHLTHGVETFAGRPVIYDNGNCLEDFWPYPWPWTKRSSLFVLELGTAGSLLRQIPALTLGMRLSRPPESLLRRMAARFLGRSRELGTAIEFVDGELQVKLDYRLPATPAKALKAG